MAYITKKSEGGAAFEPIEAGTYTARCYGVVGFGTHDTEYQGKPRKRRTVRLLFELPTETKDFGKGHEEPCVIGKTYTDSLGGGDKPSSLRLDLESWRGRPFTEEELNGFDLSKLIGVPCTLTVAHKRKQDGSGFNAVIASVGKMMKGQVCPPAVLPQVLYSAEEGDGGAFLSMPEWMRKEIQSSEEFIASMRKPALDANPVKAAADSSTEPQDHPADDIPF